MDIALQKRNDGPYKYALKYLSYAPFKGKDDYVYYRCRNIKITATTLKYYDNVLERWLSEDPNIDTDGFMGSMDCVLTHMLHALSMEGIVVGLKWEQRVIVAFTVPAHQRTAFGTAFINFIGNQQHFIGNQQHFTNGDEWICELLCQSPYGINMYVSVPSLGSANLGRILEDKNSKLNFTRYFSNPRAKIKGVKYMEYVVNLGNAGHSFDVTVTENTSIRVQEAGQAVEERVQERIYADLDAGYIGVPD